MRKLLLLAAVAALFIVALPVAAAGAASPFADVEITVETTLSDLGSSGGPFDASGDAVTGGLICEDGWTFDAFGKQSPPEGNPNGVNYKIIKVFLCDIDHMPEFDEPVDSGFVLKMQVRVDKKGDNYSWVVVDSWGVLEGLKGNGHGFGEYVEWDGDNPTKVIDYFSGKVR